MVFSHIIVYLEFDVLKKFLFNPCLGVKRWIAIIWDIDTYKFCTRRESVTPGTGLSVEPTYLFLPSVYNRILLLRLQLPPDEWSCLFLFDSRSVVSRFMLFLQQCLFCLKCLNLFIEFSNQLVLVSWFFLCPGMVSFAEPCEMVFFSQVLFQCLSAVWRCLSRTG